MPYIRHNYYRNHGGGYNNNIYHRNHGGRYGSRENAVFYGNIGNTVSYENIGNTVSYITRPNNNQRYGTSHSGTTITRGNLVAYQFGETVPSTSYGSFYGSHRQPILTRYSKYFFFKYKCS